MIEDTTVHISDREFYIIVKLLEFLETGTMFGKEDSSEISYHSFALCNQDASSVFSVLFRTLNKLDIPVEISDYYIKDIEDSYIETNGKKESHISQTEYQRILKKITEKKKISLSDIVGLSWIWYEAYENTKFISADKKEVNDLVEVIKKDINLYLDNLVNNILQTKSHNYYLFEYLKVYVINFIEENKCILKYGKNFIVSEVITSSGFLKKDLNVCIVQAMYALQRLGYVTINEIWTHRTYKGQNIIIEEKDTIYWVNFNITLEDIFIDEINREYSKNNPSNKIERFDSKKGQLYFMNETISLTNKGKETDSSLLMGTLIKLEDGDWKHNDEIFENWGYNSADIQASAKNKIYFAGKRINTLVATKTKIEDLIEITTQKARINPRYIKVDE